MARQVKPIDLKRRFGKRYRVVREEGSGIVRDPWLFQIVCRFGHIFPYGGDDLGASVDGSARIAARLRALPCVRVAQDGDYGELTAVFDVKDFDAVAAVMRPKRRRQITEEQRGKLIARLGHSSPQESSSQTKQAGPEPGTTSEPSAA